MSAHHRPKVLTIDGPSGAGKGTAAIRCARELGWGLLDSGALYRLTALKALREGVSLDDEAGIASIGGQLDVRFEPDVDRDRVIAWLDGDRVGPELRTEEAGQAASRVALLPALRRALLERQRMLAWDQPLVADGRDMGTVVFPDACCKVFLTASVEVRAIRRRQQLIEQGVTATLDDLRLALSERDAQDANRAVAPLKPADDAWIVDSSNLEIEAVVCLICERARANCDRTAATSS
ncbi:MAG: (d)CMP kinase [Thioalkalivibrionaceae bacterium]